MIDIYEKVCEYCHAPVSVFESLTEYGKHFHDYCYIHNTQKELEGYKKKWINKSLTDGDKADLVDKFNLVQKLKSERTEFRGFVPIGEFKSETRTIPEKTMLVVGTQVVVDQNGFPVFIESKDPTVSFTTLKLRPSVARIKSRIKVKKLTVQDIPLLMESLP